MSRLLRSTVVVLTLTGIGSTAVPAVAGPSLGVLLYTSAPTPGGSPYACAGTFDPSCGPLVPEVSLSRTFDGLGSPTGSGSSSFGILRARATMDDPTGFGGPGFFVTAVSFSSDVVTITSPGLDGTTGRLRFPVAISGSLLQTGSSASDWQTRVFVGGAAVAGWSGRRDGSGSSGDGFGSFGGSIDFVFGSPFELGQSVIASCAPFGGGCDTRLDSSFYWGGISSVTDATGRPVAFDLVSESGTDWRESFAPVPEPGTIGLLAAGLLGLGRARRRG